jgi:hypothetical protein
MRTKAGRATLISADCHCVADVMVYRPYLEGRFHEELGSWIAQYNEPLVEIEEMEVLVEEDERNVGSAWADLQMCWDSEHCREYLEQQGIDPEALHPKTAPTLLPLWRLTASNSYSMKRRGRRCFRSAAASGTR